MSVHGIAGVSRSFRGQKVWWIFLLAITLEVIALILAPGWWKLACITAVIVACLFAGWRANARAALVYRSELLSSGLDKSSAAEIARDVALNNAKQHWKS
jgi:hypothetical protein